MLILTRGPNKKIILTLPNEDKIVITTLKINGQQTVLGIDAPKNISVHREEVQERIDNGVKNDKK